MATRPSNGYAMTSSALAELEAELARLRRRAREEISEQLRDARSYGGGSNNDEYHALIEEQMVVDARIALLEDMVARADVVQPESAENGVATVGSTIVIEDLASPGWPRRYLLVAGHSIERDIISAASPMGQALMGVRPGTVVDVDLPNGKSRSIRVVAVEAAG